MWSTQTQPEWAESGEPLTGDPFDKTMQAMNRVMDQIEEILDRKARK